jgi:hypothetical protein
VKKKNDEKLKQVVMKVKSKVTGCEEKEEEEWWRSCRLSDRSE